MFLGQLPLLVEPGKTASYFEAYGERLGPEAGLFQQAEAFRLGVAKGRVKDLDEEIRGLTAWHDEKVAQLESMGDPSGPGAVRDQLNVQSQIMYTTQEINRKQYEKEAIMATTTLYGPSALELKFVGPETRRQVEIASTHDIAEGNIGPVAESMRGYGTKIASTLLPGVDSIVGPKIMGDIGRYGLATFTLGLSELVPKFFGGSGTPSGEGVKGYITDVGKEFSNTQASVGMTKKMSPTTQAIYSPDLGKTPILVKTSPKIAAAEIKNTGAEQQLVQQGSVGAKAVYGGLLGEYPEDMSMITALLGIAAVAWLLRE